MEPEIRIFAPMHTIYAERRGYKDGNFSEAAVQGFAAVMQYVMQNNLMARLGPAIGYMPDDMMSGTPDEWRYQVHYVLTDGDPVPADEDIQETTLDPGKMAVFPHRGPYEGLLATWQKVMGEWMPASGLTIRHAPTFEIYVNDPDNTPPDELLTEICIPVE
jgi:AraC family transcriptional regulator